MSNRTISLNDSLYQYLLDVSVREPGILRRLREETARWENASMQISPEQGRLLALLVQAIGARRCIEIGVFTGYSSLSVVLALPDDGRLVACDVSEDYTAVARRYWREAGVEDKIDLRIAPALKTLERMIDADEDRLYDFAFIDADKAHYGEYYERVLKLLKPNGLIAIDNTLWSGRVADSADDDEDTVAIREFNDKLYGDERIDLSLVPIGDGLTLARKRVL
ncbi:MAG TPA: class I SAM-dependent methyltransferase [Gammaproteobacteria bacterium]|nr:class I SAM-dependent methyltransferase [Gammaproteobacteria bacterium]